MPLSPGSRLGPYEVVAALGAGGMGEVYRARDTRLGREVAIKVLPQHLSANPEVRVRFEREAKTVSSLHHPHICTVFDVGREGDTDYLVMELLEGETLAQRLVRGALPGSELLQIGGEIAEALDRAHEAGVIHRDLKPGNIMLTKSGAKLMDFGLARATGMVGATSGSGIEALTQSPTLAAPLTAEGTIIGTFQYLAPEQLEGKEADRRSDVWALGCVLYEMATGRRAFEGKSQASLIAAIMHTQPQPVTQGAPLAPSGLERLVAGCLAKDPAERLQSAHDIRMQLAWLAEAGSKDGGRAPVAAKRRGRGRLAATLAIAGWLVALASIAWIASPGGRGDGDAFFASIVSPALAYPLEVSYGGPVALSPDGARLATIVRRGSDPVISVYDFRSGVATVLESSKGAGYPFWSPNGRWIAFFAEGKLRKVEASGGPAQPLADALAGRGGTWSPTGVIVFAPDIRGPMMKISENGGTPTPVTKPASEAITHRNPLFLPDGRRFLFIERDARQEGVGRLMAESIDGAAPRQVLGQASNVQLANGYLLFVRDQSLLAQRFDTGSLALRGPIVPIAENVAYFNPRDVGDFSVAPTGLLAFRHQKVVEGALAWFDREGRLSEVLGPKEQLLRVRPSSDLRQAALTRESADQGRDIWLLDLASKQRTRVTFSNTPSALS
jgi:hypothetical protein